MKFQCNRCNSNAIRLDAATELYPIIVTGSDEFVGLSSFFPKTPTIISILARCNSCGKKWGPASSISKLEELMVRYGVLK